ncbi:hypothetical protein [Candidatus Protochlamydia sp. R18]|uniref:hypothetical protein n=1 Tax=Candidatus Protochlamydia sp. R18 TaxID=1353977 RepID=UPI0005A75C0C|nr:hypothetical protein [Candidatus Protochlamydia sp. R18]
MNNSNLNYQIYACLPFVELAKETCIQFGAVIFWPASQYSTYLNQTEHLFFHNYIYSIGQIKAKVGNEKVEWINTIKLYPKETTCISISNQIPVSEREAVLVDALYLLYFACTFRDLYYGNEIPSFNAFRKIIPCTLDFIKTKDNWKNLYINESYREETVCIHFLDQDICQGLGKTLLTIYQSAPHENMATIHAYKRLVRSIRYFVDRFFQRFVNLFEKEVQFSEYLFEPEDVVFLASSFEALFDLNDQQVTADFKHKLRSLLPLKFTKPLELFWKWIDDFYEVKRKIIHGGTTPDPLFKLNPNFEISHISIGIKLFIYSVYYMLYRYQLIHSTHADAYTPPDFKGIHPEEVLLFFWTESSLLNKLNVYTKQFEQRSKEKELQADIHLLTTLFVSMYDRYYLHPHLNKINFIPSSLESILINGQQILDRLEKNRSVKNHQNLLDIVALTFSDRLKKRLAQ